MPTRSKQNIFEQVDDLQSLFNQKKIYVVLDLLIQIQEKLDNPLIFHELFGPLIAQITDFERHIQTVTLLYYTFRDRSILTLNHFEILDHDKPGISYGFFAQEKSTQHLFLIKALKKQAPSSVKNVETIKRYYPELYLKIKTQSPPNQSKYAESAIVKHLLNRLRIDRMYGINEYFASVLYEKLLYNRAPKEALVLDPNLESEFLYIRSKFLNHAMSYLHFADQVQHDLSGLKDFEKVMAACHLLGEADYNAGNLLIQSDGTISKIDHGQSFMVFPKNFEQFLKSISEGLKLFGYSQEIATRGLRFNIHRYTHALDQMLQQLTPEQINNIIDQKAAELEAAGFDPASIPYCLPAEKRVSDPMLMMTQTMQDIANRLKTRLNSHWGKMTEFKDQLKNILKFEDHSVNFQLIHFNTFINGQWPQDLLGEMLPSLDLNMHMHNF